MYVLMLFDCLARNETHVFLDISVRKHGDLTMDFDIRDITRHLACNLKGLRLFEVLKYT
jgi:hypothetical protein